jgi:hypothetical protein
MDTWRQITAPFANFTGLDPQNVNFLGAILVIIIVLAMFVPRQYWNPFHGAPNPHPMMVSSPQLIEPDGLVNTQLHPMIGGQRGAPFIPAQPWIGSPEYPSPYRLNQFYLGGPSKCFSCEKDVIQRGAPPQLGRHTRCFDCEKQVGRPTYGNPQRRRGHRCGDCDRPIDQTGSCGCNPRKTQFGLVNGEAFTDQIDPTGVDLPITYGRADGLTEHEANTANPINYDLTVAN